MSDDAQNQIILLQQQMRRHTHDDQESTRIIPVQNGNAGKFLKTDGSMLSWQTASGAGNVNGPASATNNDVVFFDGTTGKLIKDSNLTLSGSNTGDQTISDATISTTDITTNNVSTSKHGFAPKAPNDATKFLDGTGAYSAPGGGGVAVGTATSGQYSSTEYDNGNATGTKTISWANGNVQYVTMTGDTTFTFTNPISGVRYLLHMAGAFTPTWPASVRWPAGVTPTPIKTAGVKDIYTFVYSSKETLYDGAQNTNYSIT